MAGSNVYPRRPLMRRTATRLDVTTKRGVMVRSMNGWGRAAWLALPAVDDPEEVIVTDGTQLVPQP